MAICECGKHGFCSTAKVAVPIVSPEGDHFLECRWWVHPKGYIQNRRGRLHRLVTGAPKGMLVDHINHDKADNRRENLRIVDNHQSIRNRKKFSRSGSPQSKFIGVYRQNSGWCSKATIGGQRRHLGTFRTEIEAARAYDNATRQDAGAFAKLNFGE